MRDDGTTGSPGGSGGNTGGFGRGFGGGLGGGKFFDDLAGAASGAFSVLSGLRSEMEAMARAQAEAIIARLELVRREELDAALEVARRAREEVEALTIRVAALEAGIGTTNAADPVGAPMGTPGEGGAEAGAGGAAGGDAGP